VGIQEIITKKMERIDSLPALPVIASQLLRLLSDDKASINKMANLISSDPAITSKVLAIANSAFYGIRKQIDTIKLAMVILGLNEIRNIILSISIFRSFNDNSNDASFDRNRFWQHSIATGHFAKIIRTELKLPGHGEEFTAGLIHDIGKIIMDQYFHDQFIKALQFSSEKGISNYAAEKKMLGMTHMELGAWLANKWMLPKNLVDSIEYHHNPFSYNERHMLPALISVSNFYANKFGFGIDLEMTDKKAADEDRLWNLMMSYSNSTEIDKSKIFSTLDESIDEVKTYIFEIMSIV